MGKTPMPVANHAVRLACHRGGGGWGFRPGKSDNDLIRNVAFLQGAKGEVFVVPVVLDEQDQLAGVHDFPSVDASSSNVKSNSAPRFSTASAQTFPPWRR